MKYLNSKKRKAVLAALYRGVEAEDIEANAMAALVRAAQLFDPVANPGVEFDSYAQWFVWASISKVNEKLNSTSTIPHNRKVSLNTPIDATGDTLERFFGKCDGPNAERNEHVELIRREVDSLPARHAQVVRHRFGIDCQPMSLREIGQHLHITKERVRQIQNNSLAIIAKRIEAKGYDTTMLGAA